MRRVTRRDKTILKGVLGNQHNQHHAEDDHKYSHRFLLSGLETLHTKLDREDIPYTYLPHKRLVQLCDHRKQVRCWLL